MTPLSADERAELARLCEEATPGPWEAHPSAARWWVEAVSNETIFEAFGDKPEADAKLAAAARSALPRLLAQVDAHAADLIRYEELLARNVPEDYAGLDEYVAALKRRDDASASRAAEWEQLAHENLMRAKAAETKVDGLEAEVERMRAVVDVACKARDKWRGDRPVNFGDSWNIAVAVDAYRAALAKEKP